MGTEGSHSTQPQRHGGCDLHQPPWRFLEGCQDRWGGLAVFSPAIPPPPAPIRSGRGRSLILRGALAAVLGFVLSLLRPLRQVLGTWGGGGARVPNASGEARVCPGLLGRHGGQEKPGNLTLLPLWQPREGRKGLI